MGAFLAVTGFLGFIVFLILSIVSVFRRAGKGKKRLITALLFIAVFIVGAAISPNSSKTSETSIKNDATKVSATSEVKKNTDTPKKAAPVSTSSSKKASISSKLIPAVVAKNVDGDTIKVSLKGKDETIRMLLIDTPEDVDPYKPVEPYGYKAANYAKSVLPVGKHIYLQEGKKGYQRDKYNRLLAYVYITPKDMYNKDVVQKGLARVAYIYPPNTDHLSELQSAQNNAKSKKLGIWSISNYASSNGYSLSISCSYAEKNGYSTRGCGTTSKSSHKSTATSHKSTSTSVSTAVSGSSLKVSPGQYASVSIKTKPGASGTIEVIYNSGPSKAAGLYPQTADGNGNITWTWKVGTRTAPGTYPVTITVNGSTITKYLSVN